MLVKCKRVADFASGRRESVCVYVSEKERERESQMNLGWPDNWTTIKSNGRVGKRKPKKKKGQRGLDSRSNMGNRRWSFRIATEGKCCTWDCKWKSVFGGEKERQVAKIDDHFRFLREKKRSTSKRVGRSVAKRKCLKKDILKTFSKWRQST